MNTLVAFVKGVMRQRGLSVRALALELGVNHTTVSRWLSGKARPSPASCKRLADCAGTRAEWVLSLAGYLPPVTETSVASWPPFGEYVRLKYGDVLDEDSLVMIEDLIERRRRRGEQSSETGESPAEPG